MRSAARYQLAAQAAETRHAERLDAWERRADAEYERAAALADAEATPTMAVDPDAGLLRRQRLAWAVADLVAAQLICCDQANF